MIAPAIGGFLPLRLPTGPTARSVYALWIGEGRDAWLLHNARSALHLLWSSTMPRRVWLPSYVCGEVPRSVPAGIDTRYYPLDEELVPDVNYLASHIESGDHVLAVDYFGCPARKDFGELVRSRPEVGWIEDCAHALDVGDHAWGDWLLYSPRKLVGVPDGGILVGRRKPLTPMATTTLTDLSFMRPALERFEDAGETDNERWYATYVKQEAAMTVGTAAMSRLSIEVLRSSDAASDSAVRRRNYAILHERLRELALVEEPIDFVPMGFAIRVRDADRVAARLAQSRIFAARHWRELPSAPGAFPVEHAIARELITLPCDYRYGDEDMHRVAEATIRAIEA